MLCKACGTWSEDNAIVCPKCGTVLPRGENRDEGLQAMRQGKRARLAAAAGEQPSISQSRQGAPRASRLEMNAAQKQRTQEVRIYGDAEIYDGEGNPILSEDTGIQRTARHRTTNAVLNDVAYHGQDIDRRKHRKRRRTYEVHGRMINWMVVGIVVILLVIMSAVGFVMYLRNTDNGQKLLARWGRDASAAAMWEVGNEKYDMGDISGGIELFEKALAKDEEAEELNVTWMLILGEAYEAAGRLEDAEALYIRIYTDIVPSSREAYASEIRILSETGREPEAAVLMQTAYEMTGLSSFKRQRTQLLPLAPSVGKTAGNYEEAQNLVLTSSQGFDIYYTFDENAELPQDGTLYTEAIRIDEGTWKLRAVAVHGNLVSDELTGTYRVVLPSPGTPGCNLAPATYKKKQSVRLRISLDDEEKIKLFKRNNITDTREVDITIFYTIDGTTPDEDSPIWDGTPIKLPGGYVTLRATAVNGYGKASNTLEVLYKIEQKPWPEASFSAADTVTGITIMGISQEEFQKKHGIGQKTETLEDSPYEGNTVKLSYEWGYAVFTKKSGDMYLAELYFISTAFSGPRGTSVGSSMAQVVAAFRDMGQVESASGNRGLYKNDTGTGKIYAREDGTKLIRYMTTTADSHTLRLDYTIGQSGSVTAIDYLYLP